MGTVMLDEHGAIGLLVVPSLKAEVGAELALVGGSDVVAPSLEAEVGVEPALVGSSGVMAPSLEAEVGVVLAVVGSSGVQTAIVALCIQNEH